MKILIWELWRKYLVLFDLDSYILKLTTYFVLDMIWSMIHCICPRFFTSMGEFLVVDRMYRSSYIFLIGQDPWLDLFTSVMKYLMLFEKLEIYHYFYMHNLAYGNLQKSFHEQLWLSDNVVKGSASQRVPFVGCLLYLVLIWIM